MKKISSMINVIILAGGFGTRIQSISKGIAKSLLPIRNKVFLDYILDWIAKYEIKRVILSLHHKSWQFLSYLKQNEFQFEIIPIIEPAPMGTGGAVKYVLENVEISDPFGVVNGDTLHDFNLLNMVKTFYKFNCPAMIGLSYVNNAKRYGTVSFDEKTNKALSFNEKGTNVAGWINNGCYIFRPDVFGSFDGKFSIEQDFFPELVKTKKIYVYPTEGKFLDIGIPEDYKKIIEKFVNY